MYSSSCAAPPAAVKHRTDEPFTFLSFSCLIFAHTALCTILQHTKHLLSNIQVLLYLLYWLMDYSLTPLLPLCLFLSSCLSSIISQLSLSLSSLLPPIFSLFTLPTLSSSPPSSFGSTLSHLYILYIFFAPLCCITFHNHCVRHLADSLIWSHLHTHTLVPCFLHLLTFIYPGDVVLLFHRRPISRSCIYKSHLGKALAQPQLCAAGC